MEQSITEPLYPNPSVPYEIAPKIIFIRLVKEYRWYDVEKNIELYKDKCYFNLKSIT